MKTKPYIIPQLTAITIDTAISLQMQSHEIGTPPPEPGWETEFNHPLNPYQDFPVDIPINDNLDLLP
ncbi:MAG: hypothetical protein LBV75_00085 [Paludibacter sp.]|nr:hypothetical protein [Paludibacter sp.]